MALIPIVENKKKSLGIYVHIPFCRSKCEYCDFYSIPGARSRDLMDRYLDAVILHIREAAQGAAVERYQRIEIGRTRERAVDSRQENADGDPGGESPYIEKRGQSESYHP